MLSFTFPVPAPPDAFVAKPQGEERYFPPLITCEVLAIDILLRNPFKNRDEPFVMLVDVIIVAIFTFFLGVFGKQEIHGLKLEIKTKI